VIEIPLRASIRKVSMVSSASFVVDTQYTDTLCCNLAIQKLTLESWNPSGSKSGVGQDFELGDQNHENGFKMVIYFV
jgi:hypothetical protein